MTSRDEVWEEEFAGLSSPVGHDGFERNDTVDRLKDNFRLVFERSIDAAFLLEGDVFVDCNEAALALPRCPTKEQLIGLRPSNISPGRQPDGLPSSESIQKMVDTALSEGGVRFGWTHVTFDGQEMLVDVSLAAISLNERPDDLCHFKGHDGLDAEQTSCVDILEDNLRHLVSPFPERHGMRCANLTLREMRIADLIKNGKTTKEICLVLQMSASAVNFHRNNIRKKPGLSNHKLDLAAYFSSL
jgi:DNA-binding CsgD family transcriptional regulator